MINPITKGIVALATAMGYGTESDYKGTSVAEVLSEVFSKMGYGKKSDYKVSTVTDVLYDAAKIAKDKGGPGGDDSTLISLIDRSITEIKNDNITSVGGYAFGTCFALTTVDLPNVTSIGNGAFDSCSALTTVDLPNVTSIGNGVFNLISSNAVINIGAAEGEILGAPWGAPNGVTINYNVN